MKVIAGKFKGRKIHAPKTTSTRPTQSMLREAVFNICQNEIEGAIFLDLFAGSGAMGIEALSRGAAKVFFIEQNPQACHTIWRNIQDFHIEEKTVLIKSNAEKGIEKLKKQNILFSMIYVDPPYDLGFDLELLVDLLTKNGSLFFEERKKTFKHLEIPGLIHQDTRKFGMASLTIYKKS